MHGNGTVVFITYIEGEGRIESSDGGKVWPSGPRKSPLDTRFSPQGIVVCKSGDILISPWNNEIADRSIGKVISMTCTFQLAGSFEIFMDKNRPLLVCPTYLKENCNDGICVSDVGAVVSRTLEACCASGITEPQETATLSRTDCVAILRAT